jgi:hypothetical protein
MHDLDERGQGTHSGQAPREKQMTLLDAQLAARLDKPTEEVAGMTWDELVRARDDVQRQIDELNAWIAVLEAAQAVARDMP